MCAITNISERAHLKRVTYLALILFAIVSIAKGQETVLKQQVTLSYKNTSIEDILADISSKTNIDFSYQSALVKSQKPISYSCNNKTLEVALKEMFKNTNLDYSLVGKHIVITKRESKAETPPAPPKVKKHTINGYIFNAATKEALIGAAIYNRATGMGALSNNFGYYSITLPEGQYSLEVSYIGHAPIQKDIDLKSNTVWNAKLTTTHSFVEEVIIKSENKEELIFKSLSAQSNLKPYEISQEAAALGETDMLKSLDKLPGISFQGDGSSYFYVRGGNRDQNLILLDDAPIYNPSHMLGLFTPIIPDAVKNTNIYKADFPIQYGGRLSSVVDIRTKDGNKERFSGSANMGLVSTRFSVEGPIKKGASSYFVSYRRSYFGWLLKSSNPDIKEFFFNDYTTKFNLKLTKKDRLFVTFYHGKDQLLSAAEEETLTGVEWSNTSLTLRWNHIFAEKLFLNTTLNSGKYEYLLHTDQYNNLFWNSTISSNHLNSEFTYFANPNNKFRFGIKLGGYFFNPGNYNGPEIGAFRQVSELNSVELITYAGNEHQLGDKILLNYGMRLSQWKNIGEAYVYTFQNYEPIERNYYKSGETYYSKGFIEPRISISYKLAPFSSLKASYNRTTQNIHLINNSVSPFNTLEVWLPSGPNIKPQLANIYNLGFVHTWNKKGIDLSTDIYHKTLYNQVNFAEHADLLLNSFIEGEIRQGNGKAYGFELYLKKNKGKFTWQVGYAYTRSYLQINDLNENQRFRAKQDKPIEFSISAGKHLKPRWLLSASYVLNSGQVTTTPSGFYNYRGVQTPIYSEKHNDRLPNYTRFDIASDFRLNKDENGVIEHHLVISFYNMFWKKNAAFLYYNKIKNSNNEFVVPADIYTQPNIITTYRYIYSIVPSLSYNLRF